MGAAIHQGYEVGLCHDLLEGGTATCSNIRGALLSFDHPVSKPKISSLMWSL